LKPKAEDFLKLWKGDNIKQKDRVR